MFDLGKSGKTDRAPSQGQRRHVPVSVNGANVGFYAQRLARMATLIVNISLKYGLSAFHTARKLFFSMSGQFLILTAIFIMLVEAVILIPSLAQDQEYWLLDRINKAEIASQSIDTAQNNAVSKSVSTQLRRSAGVLYLSVEVNGDTIRLFDSKVVVPEEVLDLRQSHANLVHDVLYLWAPWQTFMGKSDRLIHIVAKPRVRAGQEIEIVVKAQPLRDYLKASLIGMLRMSLSISFLAGFLIFIGLSVFIVRPIRKLTKGIVAFKTNPEGVLATAQPSQRRDEIGQIERELASMQEEVRQALRSRARLAALGQAVSKINHDLRNMLTSAQMASDRLANSADPTVAKALPRLERALDRALSLAQNVLTYGKSDEQTPQIQIIKLKDLAEAAAEDAGLGLTPQSQERVRFSLKIAKGFFLEADPEQLHRLLVNLMRNARQAIELQPNRKTLGRVTLVAVKTADDIILIVSDNGPGIPEKTREKLFQPFTSSTTPGGSGLGLAISRELAQLHGGDVRLVSSCAEGTTFEVRLPLKP